MFIGEAPGKEEDLRGEPFVGRAGRILDEALMGAGVSRREVFMANLVKCRPPNNRRPRKDEVRACARFLESEFDAVRPEVVCALGGTVAEALLGRRQKMSAMVGRRLRMNLFGHDVLLIVSYHPAACLYQRRNLAAFNKAVSDSVAAAGLGRRH